jgi:chromosome segregation ATPase
LISQLHSLREEAGPKEIQIIKMSEKLNELEKQYEKALKAISEKEQHLQQNSTMVHLLHKQVRELRSSLVQRESSLKRASKLLDEFKYSLQQARFSSRKITVPTTATAAMGAVESDSSVNDDLDYRKREVFVSKKSDVVELISSTPVMEESLQRLYDVLNPHSTSEVSQE